MIDTSYLLLVGAVTIAILVATFDSIVWVVIAIVFYGVGRLWGEKLFEYVSKNESFSTQQYVTKSENHGICQVCSGNNCNRHRPVLHNANVQVPRDLDMALQNLLEKVIQTYVSAWYSNFSSDDAFLQQLRLTTSIATRNVIRRLVQVNVSQVIFDNLIPLALQHAQDWQTLARNAQIKGGKPEDFVLDHFGDTLHPAACSREAEVNYLRGLVTELLPYLLPSTYISTNNKVILREILSNWVLLPAMDALADPDNINFLIKLCTQCEGVLTQASDSVNVPLLQAWATPVSIQAPQDSLKPSLDQVLNDPQFLYVFMQHVKETGPVNLLQFCLDIDDLGKRILNPDMTREIEENLFIDAQNIYSTYLDPSSMEYLNLPYYISQGLAEILEEGPDKIQDLRTSRPLYEAHQEAHALLEAACLPSFHHSYELYELLCGPPASSNFVKSSNITGISGGIGVGARLSNQLGKIRGVLSSSTVDGATFNAPDVFQAEEVDCSSQTDNDANPYSDKSCRDLTTWRVTVPHVDGGGSHPLYMVAVDTVADNKSWTVLRRDQDFYTLRAKLMEFHGDRELNDSPLPTRKNQHVSLIANRQHYQDFLQKLLSKPTLRSSELVHTFLTAQNLKTYFTNYSTPDIGVLYQSVAHKLRKEKGQHLDKFMNTFLASTNVDNEHINLGVDPINDHIAESAKKDNRLSGIFGNNLNITRADQYLSSNIGNRQLVKGACFCIAQAVDSLNIPSSISTFIWLIASWSRSKLDPMCNNFLNDTLTRLLDGGRAAMVIKLLHNTIFGLKTSKKVHSRTLPDEEKFTSARDGLYSLLPWWLIGIRTKYWYKMMDSLLEPLQHASLNKHLAYGLVDQVVLQLFPELSR